MLICPSVGGVALERSEVHRATSEGGDGVSILSRVPGAGEIPYDELHLQVVPVAQPRRHGIEVVGLPGFEPGSIAPKATSIDQTNPQAP